MEPTKLIEQSLDLRWPWYVEEIEVDPAARRVDLHLNFEVGGTFSCGTCGADDCKAYDTTSRRWRHLPLFEYDSYVRARGPRIQCPSCGVRRARLPWARARTGFTHAFEEQLAAMAEQVPIVAIARLLGEHDTRLGYVLRQLERDEGSRAAL